MSKQYKADDIIRLLRDTKTIAKFTLDAINEYLDKCNTVKGSIDVIARNIRKGVSLNVTDITGSKMLEILEVTALAPGKARRDLLKFRETLERELIDPARHSASIASNTRGFLNKFYPLYQENYRIIFGEQIKALVAIQGVLSESGTLLAASGAKDVQDNAYNKIKKEIADSVDQQDPEWFMLEDSDEE